MNRNAVVWSFLLASACVTSALTQSTPAPNVSVPVPVPNQAQTLAQFQQQFLQQFDLDHNGQLSAQENMIAQEAMRRAGLNLGIAPAGSPAADYFSKQFDRDGDGKLSPVEAMAAQSMFQRIRGGHSGTRGGVQVGGGGGSAMPQQPVMPAPVNDKKSTKPNPFVKRFDKDGDGKLNAEEKVAAQAELKKDKSKEKAEKKD